MQEKHADSNEVKKIWVGEDLLAQVLKKEDVSLNIDWIKFLIGLATGTLVFSVTFIEKLAPQMRYTPILVVGWACLLISIFTGVYFLSLLLRQFFEIRNLPPLLEFLAPTQLGTGTLKQKVAEMVSDLKTGTFRELMETEEYWKKLAKIIIIFGRMDIFKEIRKSAKDEVYESMESYMRTRLAEEEVEDPESVLTRFRRVWAAVKQMENLISRFRLVQRLSQLCEWSFYGGIFAIALFGFLNVI